MSNIMDLEGKFLLKAIRDNIELRSDLMIGGLKYRTLTSSDLMLDMLDNDLHNEVSIYRNTNFCLEYDKITKTLKLQTTYSNQEITSEWTSKLNSLVMIKEDIELRKENGEFKKLAEEFRKEYLEKTEEQELVEVKEEIIVKEEIDNFFSEGTEEKIIKEKKSKAKFPNYKKLFNNGKRARRIYFEEMKNGDYKLGNVIYSNNEEMINIFIDCNNSSNSNFVFEDKEKEIYILAKNNGDYSFEILGKLEDDLETINKKY